MDAGEITNRQGTQWGSKKTTGIGGTIIKDIENPQLIGMEKTFQMSFNVAENKDRRRTGYKELDDQWTKYYLDKTLFFKFLKNILNFLKFFKIFLNFYKIFKNLLKISFIFFHF